jgi:hypothetical protein
MSYRCSRAAERGAAHGGSACRTAGMVRPSGPPTGKVSTRVPPPRTSRGCRGHGHDNLDVHQGAVSADRPSCQTRPYRALALLTLSVVPFRTANDSGHFARRVPRNAHAFGRFRSSPLARRVPREIVFVPKPISRAHFRSLAATSDLSQPRPISRGHVGAGELRATPPDGDDVRPEPVARRYRVRCAGQASIVPAMPVDVDVSGQRRSATM